jgi:4-azaleucine resistance transporter AzlC
LVNSRHVFYALSFPLHRVHGVPAKLYSTYTLSDEAYAVGVSPEAATWTTRPILLMQMCFHLLWVAGATLGGLAGEALPIDRLVGLDFALTALFIVLGIDAYRQRPDRLTAVCAAACAIAAWLVVPGQMLVCAFAAFAAVLMMRMFLQRRAERA